MVYESIVTTPQSEKIMAMNPHLSHVHDQQVEDIVSFSHFYSNYRRVVSLNVAQICITVLNEDMSNILICNGKNRRIHGKFEGW